MLPKTIFSLFKLKSLIYANKERVNSLFMLCASSLTDGVLLFYCGINCQKGEVTYLFRFSLVSDLGF